MPISMETLSLELLGLPASSRAFLAAKLLASLEETEEPEAEQAWREEIQRRLRETVEGNVELRAGEEVFRDLRQAKP